MWSRGPRAHATVVHGCTMRHTAEAVPPRCPGHHKLAHERTDRYASQRSGQRTGQCSHAHKDAARLDCPRLALGCQAMFCPPSARQRAQTAAAPCRTSLPPRGLTKEGTGAAALCPCHGCLSPPHPRTGALPIAALLEVSSCAAPATGPLRSFLSPCKRSYCNARGLLRQGPASWRAPAGRPPRAGRQRRPEGRPGKPRCWRTTVAGPACDGGQATRTRAGRGAGVGRRPAWWHACPHTPRGSLRSVVGRTVLASPLREFS